MHKSMRSIAVMLIICVVSMAAIVANAQQITPPSAGLEFIGTIESVGPTSIVVSGQTIDISAAEINGALTVGAVVKVEATIAQNGQITAQEVKTPEANDLDLNQIELKGTLESFDGTTLGISGLTLDATGALLDGPVAPGDLIEVRLTIGDNGVWIVTRIEAAGDRGGNDDNGLGNDNSFGNDLEFGNELAFGNNDDFGNEDNGNDLGNDDNGDDFGNEDNGNDDVGGEDLKLTGALDQIGDGFIVVAGQQIDVRNAHVEGSLILGAIVTVELRLIDNVLTASEVKHEQRGQSLRVSEDSGSGSDNSGGGGDCGSGGDGWTAYTIQSGDSLSDIAHRSGSSTDDLADANCIENRNRIVVGQVIRVPNEPAPRLNLVSSNDDRGSDDFEDGNDDRGNDDNGNDDNFDDHGGNRGQDGSDDISSGNDDHGNDDNGNDDHGGDDNGGNSGHGGGDDGGSGDGGHGGDN